MRRLLITGKNSYIGNAVEHWLSTSQSCHVDVLDMLGDEWRNTSFTSFDCILHVAGIAHVSADPSMKELYMKVNRDLAIDVAAKAKNEGVKQFIFMSSMIVYGADGQINTPYIIDERMQPNPVDFYGQSKLEADLAIQSMKEEFFHPVIIRTPVVYGPGCKGNFPKLVQLAKKLPLVPKITNERSMIFIDNLCEFIRLCIVHEESGVFFPQNREYVSTVDIINQVREIIGKHTYQTSVFNGLATLLSKRFAYINKVFGNKVYKQAISNHFEWSYCLVDKRDSIIRSIEGVQ